MVVFKSECPKRCWTCFKVIPASKQRLACVCLKPWILIGRRSLPSTILISHFLGNVLGIGFLNSFSKMYLVSVFCFLHFFKILFVFLSRLISRLLLTVFVFPISSPAKPLVMALFMSRVLSFQSLHSRAKISPFRAPVKARRRNRVILSRSFVLATSFKNF